MRRDGGGIGAVLPPHAAQQAEGEERQHQAQRQRRHNRADQRPAAGGVHGDTALEADGEHQVDRQRLGGAFGDFQIGTDESGDRAQHEGQDHRRQQIAGGKVEEVGHGGGTMAKLSPGRKG